MDTTMIERSLKSILPELADILGMSFSALYERQRALVDIGQFPRPTGRGPGSGIPATAENVADLIFAIMVADGIEEMKGRFFTAPDTARHMLIEALAGRQHVFSRVSLVRTTGPIKVVVEVSAGTIARICALLGHPKAKGIASSHRTDAILNHG